MCPHTPRWVHGEICRFVFKILVWDTRLFCEERCPFFKVAPIPIFFIKWGCQWVPVFQLNTPLLCNRKHNQRFPVSVLTDFFVWPAADFKLCDWFCMFGVTLEKHFGEKRKQRTKIYKSSCVALWERGDGVHGIRTTNHVHLHGGGGVGGDAKNAVKNWKCWAIYKSFLWVKRQEEMQQLNILQAVVKSEWGRKTMGPPFPSTLCFLLPSSCLTLQFSARKMTGTPDTNTVKLSKSRFPLK